MSRDTDQGLAYLTALKGSSAGSAAPQLDETPADPRAGVSFTVSENRRSRRFKCEGSAEIRTEGGGIRTWATFTDISLHGCYVEVQATYPVGTLLHLKLDLEDIRVETQGIVRVSCPSLGMGIAFADITPHNTAELRRLLAGMTRPSLIMKPDTSSARPAVAGERPTATAVHDPAAAVRAMIQFFDGRQMMSREDFLRILKKS
jgi:hypothetical protein